VKVQNFIDDCSARRFKTLAAARVAKTAEERAKFEREAERLKETLAALVEDRDRAADEAKVVTALPAGVMPVPPTVDP
jgi:hypothetical protein